MRISVLLVLLLAACSPPPKTYDAKGNEVQYMLCSSPPICYNYAKNVCPSGYKLLEDREIASKGQNQIKFTCK